MQQFFDFSQWRPPAHWDRITTIDMHTGGEPLRVITSGLPPIEGRTVLEKRRYFRENYDHIRTGTMWEPRGHADMYGAVITRSVDADLDVFFLHNEGYSTMCGHAIIALTKFVFETGILRKESDNPQLTINVPAGKVYAQAVIEDDKVREVVEKFRAKYGAGEIKKYYSKLDVAVEAPLGRTEQRRLKTGSRKSSSRAQRGERR